MARAQELGDRRRSVRVRSLRLVTLEEVGAGPQEAQVHVARTLDVSGKGIRVETSRELPVGQELELQIAVDDKLIQAKGRVVYSETGEGLVATGIEWVDIEPSELALLVGSASR